MFKLFHINKNRKELEDLLRLLAQKKNDIDQKDEIIARLESEIDDIYVDMEKLEHEIEWKNEQIRELEN
jgi:peptidoglycan hydrolase CwlO-like protein